MHKLGSVGSYTLIGWKILKIMQQFFTHIELICMHAILMSYIQSEANLQEMKASKLKSMSIN